MTSQQLRTRLKPTSYPYFYNYDYMGSKGLCIFFELNDYHKPDVIRSLTDHFAQEDMKKLTGLQKFTTTENHNEISENIQQYYRKEATEWIDMMLETRADTYVEDGYFFTFVPQFKNL